MKIEVLNVKLSFKVLFKTKEKYLMKQNKKEMNYQALMKILYKIKKICQNQKKLYHKKKYDFYSNYIQCIL